VTALYALALVVFAAATPPILWPGALIFVLVWAFFPRWRAHLTWSVGFFTLYLFIGSDPSDTAEMRRLALLAGELALGMLAFAWSAALAGGNSSWAPLPFLAWALLARPSGLVLGLALLAWAGWQLVRQQQQSRELGRSFAIDPRAGKLAAAILALMVLLILAVGTLKLPGASPGATASPAAPSTTVASPQEPTGATPSSEQTIRPEPVIVLPPWQLLVFKAFNRLIDVSLVALLLLLAVLWWRLLTTPAERQRVDRRSLILVLLALAGLTLAAIWLPMAFPGEGTGLDYGSHGAVVESGDLEAGGESPTPKHVTQNSWLGYLLIIASLGVLAIIGVMIYLVVKLLGYEPQPAAKEASAPPPGKRTPEFAGRVRTAYREFLRLMLAHAPASRSETPREYARRLEKRFPQLADWVRELTDLYEPVRYGGLADEREAARAEEMVGLIAAELEREREET